MSICSGIGNGIKGVIGKWGAGLGSALGLGAVVDLGTRAYTGYGLLETLNVPYIECPDETFVTAIEWYGAGMQCSKKKEIIKKTMPSSQQQTQKKGAIGYAEEIEALGGSTITYFGRHGYGFQVNNTFRAQWSEPRSGHFDTVFTSIDKCGNVFKEGTIDETFGFWGQDTRGGYFLDSSFSTPSQWGIGSYFFINFRQPVNLETKSFLNSPLKFDGLVEYWTYLGIQATIPSNYEKAPPAASIPPPRGFSPNPPPPPEECEMSCACITPADIEKAVKKALGLSPFAPEKLIREMGAKMFAAPGPSVVPIVPQSLIDAIAALIAANYMRAGYGRYPVVMPDSLIASDNPAGDAVPTNVIENQAEWLEWMVKQKDAIDGEWPIDIAIKDGVQQKPMRFENIAEAIAELTGLVVQTAADADTAVNAACTAAGIAQKGVNAATIAQKNVECLIQCFGFRTSFKALFVQSSITPADPDDKSFNVRKFLSPSSQNLAVLTDNDDFDFQAVCDRILRNTEIARAAVARNVDKDGLPGDFARNQRKYDAAEALQDTKKAMEKLESSIKQQNPQMQLKIKVNGSSTENLILGNNFVIKRPKA